MGLCEDSAFLHLLPTSGWHLIWSWETGNGTTVRKIGSLSPRSDCFVELVNFSIMIIVLLVTIIMIINYKCKDQRRRWVEKIYSRFLLPKVQKVWKTTFFSIETNQTPKHDVRMTRQFEKFASSMIFNFNKKKLHETRKVQVKKKKNKRKDKQKWFSIVRSQREPR